MRRGAMGLVTTIALTLAACTSGPPPHPIPTGPSSAVVVSPAPRTCPVGGGAEGRGPLATAAIVRVMGGHVPSWLPEGFGLNASWQTEKNGGSVVWTDERCREVTVRFSAAGDLDSDGAGTWRVSYDVPGGCGNYVLGTGRCLGYTVFVKGGYVAVQMMGVDRPEGDRVITSIPCGFQPGPKPCRARS